MISIGLFEERAAVARHLLWLQSAVEFTPLEVKERHCQVETEERSRYKPML